MSPDETVPPIALLLPSYGRRDELEKVLRETPLGTLGRFVVVANYPDNVLERLQTAHASQADVLDEREFGRLGGAKAYNLAFDEAKRRGYRYTVHYADDVLPASRRWLARAAALMAEHRVDLGIFSSDEGHFGTFGWNVIRDVPIAHFFIADVATLEAYFNPEYRQYVVDLEIAARVLRDGGRIALLPVKFRHYRSPLARSETHSNWEHDIAIFLRDYPEYVDWMGNGRERMLLHRNAVTIVKRGTELRGLTPWPPHREALRSTARRHLAPLVRRLRRRY